MAGPKVLLECLEIDIGEIHRDRARCRDVKNLGGDGIETAKEMLS